jgi:dTDP-4-amino-4,6-dideoxygalactose transaminase
MASIGVSQIKRVDEFIDSRRRVCRLYNEAFSKIAELKPPRTDFEGVSPFIYSLRVPAALREKLIAHLQEQLIDTGIHFIPVHRHSHFRKATHGDLSVTEQVVKEVLTLPLHSNMKADFVERVIDGVSSFFKP